MGPTGARRLIDMAQSRPYAPAAAVFPGPARANPRCSMTRAAARARGRGLSLAGRALCRGAGGTGQQGGDPNRRTSPPTPGPRAKNAWPASSSPEQDRCQAEQTGARSPNRARVRREPILSRFHGLFRSAGASEPVAPVVSALWSNPAPSPSVPRRPSPNRCLRRLRLRCGRPARPVPAAARTRGPCSVAGSEPMGLR